MRFKNILVTLLILILLIAGVLFILKKARLKNTSVPSPTPSIEQKIESKFKNLIIPEDAERVELKNVSGTEGYGMATKSEILADLPEPLVGQKYKVWLEKDGKTVLLGNMTEAKGGWILNYNSSNYPGYNKIIVTLNDAHILEGSF
jgi:hypothetical protein